VKPHWVRLLVGYGAAVVVFVCGYINAIHVVPGEFRAGVGFLLPFFFGVSFLPATGVLLDWVVQNLFFRNRQEAGTEKASPAALVLSAIAAVLMLYFFYLTALEVLYAYRTTR
jgi:hypothetical protein